MFCYFQCCGSVSIWYGSGSGSLDPFREITDPDPAPNPTNTNFFFFYFFPNKNIFLKKMNWFVNYGKYLCPRALNISLIFMKKIYDIHKILVDFCGNFPGFWLIFLLIGSVFWNRSGSGWPKWNGSGSATLVILLKVWKCWRASMCFV